jgi:hypothetical protein
MIKGNTDFPFLIKLFKLLFIKDFCAYLIKLSAVKASASARIISLAPCMLAGRRKSNEDPKHNIARQHKKDCLIFLPSY